VFIQETERIGEQFEERKGYGSGQTPQLLLDDNTTPRGNYET
jgi:hypothetical protein